MTLAFVSRVALAQTGTISDSLSESFLDKTGSAVSLTPPAVFITIPETAAGDPIYSRGVLGASR